jgi:hypothetical protein
MGIVKEAADIISRQIPETFYQGTFPTRRSSPYGEGYAHVRYLVVEYSRLNGQMVDEADWYHAPLRQRQNL